MAYSVSLLTVNAGGSHSRPIEALMLEYLKRCAPVFSATARSFRSLAALLAAAGERQRRDAAALWLADTAGQSLDSEAFARRIEATRDGGMRHLLLAIGPADGWTDEARGQANLRVSLGPMTLPHELAALVLAEQVYRASTILLGHPYHLGH